MKQYLKMVDVFKGKLFIDSDCDDVIVDDLSLTVLESFSGSNAAKFALHAINSHDELVQMNQDLLNALESIENDAGQVPKFMWDMIQAAIAKAKGGAA